MYESRIDGRSGAMQEDGELSRIAAAYRQTKLDAFFHDSGGDHLTKKPRYASSVPAFLRQFDGNPRRYTSIVEQVGLHRGLSVQPSRCTSGIVSTICASSLRNSSLTLEGVTYADGREVISRSGVTAIRFDREAVLFAISGRFSLSTQHSMALA